jgi:hypothetical protein
MVCTRGLDCSMAGNAIGQGQDEGWGLKKIDLEKVKGAQIDRSVSFTLTKISEKKTKD